MENASKISRRKEKDNVTQIWGLISYKVRERPQDKSHFSPGFIYYSRSMTRLLIEKSSSVEQLDLEPLSSSVLADGDARLGHTGVFNLLDLPSAQWKQEEG